MGQVSKYPVSSQVYKRCWEIFTKTLINIKNEDDAKLIINDLLTPVERIMLVKRLAIATLLKQGFPYREISKIIRVSLPTISSVNSSLRFGEGGYNKVLDRILKNEEFIEDFRKIVHGIVSVGAIGGKGSHPWRYLKRELEKNSKNKKPF